GQGFNMTIRDIKILTKIISNRYELGLPIDSSVAAEFENILKHKNFIFSSGVDFIYEFFNLERKTQSNVLSKSIQIMTNNRSINKVLTKIADNGILF
ncbi:ubiquinone biosynthesis protein UbiB, partial [Candidatus Pelagibacter sp.]|nr:ubiquinone biosynthesis protein UbiB [Candidatus Pelagibacter sp.]